MDSHFSEDILKQNLDCLANRRAASTLSDADGWASCAEARFDIEQSVQRRAYLAHLEQNATG